MAEVVITNFFAPIFSYFEIFLGHSGANPTIGAGMPEKNFKIWFSNVFHSLEMALHT